MGNSKQSIEEAQGEPSEKFSVVPNQFFDLFTRVIPGGVLIFVLISFGGPDLLKSVTCFFIPSELRDQTVSWLVIVIAVAYALGHALSPLVKLLDRVWKYCRSKAWYKKKYPQAAALFGDETRRYNSAKLLVRLKRWNQETHHPNGNYSPFEPQRLVVISALVRLRFSGCRAAGIAGGT